MDPSSNVNCAPLSGKKVRYRHLDPLRFVVKHIKDGNSEALREALRENDIDSLFRERLLSPRVPKGQSPLVTAAQYQKKDMLTYMLDNYQVNLEQETSTDIEGGHPVIGATPLWTSSTLGYIEIVKELVKRGANIEHTTDSHSSPLRGAAFDGHLEVVQFLIDKGADIDKPNQVGQSPLTIAAAMKKTETVKFLLEKGANIHHRGHNGDTPLHVAVESGSLEMTQLLVKHGAKNVPNDVGYTPAIMACCYGHQDIMTYLNDSFKLQSQELYDCYCLLFAKEVLNSQLSKAKKLLLKAVEVRRGDSKIKVSTSNEIYDNVQEPVNEAEVHLLLNDELKSFYLCAVLCERILGAIHPTTPFYIRISGDMALEESHYAKCMKLWLRSLEFDKAARMAYELQIIEDLLFSVRGFCSMIDAGYTPEFHQHFEWGMKEFQLAKESKIEENDVVFCLCRLLAVWFKAIDTMTDLSCKLKEKEKLGFAAKTLCNAMIDKRCPLLIACLTNLSSSCKSGSAVNSVAKAGLPLHKVISLLIENGCPVNCEDLSGNFPLHLAVQLKEDSSFNCVKTLLDCGAHVDAVNHNKETALQVAIAEKSLGSDKRDMTSIIEYITKATRENLNLQCLCAKTIIHRSIPYMDVLPSFLISFVAEHESDDQVTVSDEKTDNDAKAVNGLASTDTDASSGYS
jgi:Fem-1 family protein b